jgi:hypothetical protein
VLIIFADTHRYTLLDAGAATRRAAYDQGSSGVGQTVIGSNHLDLVVARTKDDCSAKGQRIWLEN